MSRVLFVYGTLQRGQRNHKRLGNSTYIGRAVVGGELFQFPTRNFPVLRQHPNHLVHGELYSVEEDILAVQDAAEKWYKRKVVLAYPSGGGAGGDGRGPIYCDLYEGLKYLPYFLARELPGGSWPG